MILIVEEITFGFNLSLLITNKETYLDIFSHRELFRYVSEYYVLRVIRENCDLIGYTLRVLRLFLLQHVLQLFN